MDTVQALQRRAKSIPVWTKDDFVWADPGNSYDSCYIRERDGVWTFYYVESLMTLEQSMDWPIKTDLTEAEVLAALEAGIHTYDGKKPVFRVPAGGIS